MKKIISLVILVVLLILMACSNSPSSTSIFLTKSSEVTVWQDDAGTSYVILAVEVENTSNKPVYFKPSDFEITDESGQTVLTLNGVNAYPPTVEKNGMGVYYTAVPFVSSANSEEHLKAIPHINAEISTLSRNERNQLQATGASTGGSKQATVYVLNSSRTTSYQNVNVAVVSRTNDGKIVSVMTGKADTINPKEEIEITVKDCLGKRSLSPDFVTRYQLFAYIMPGV